MSVLALSSPLAHIPRFPAFSLGRRHHPARPSPLISCGTPTTAAANPAEKHPRRSGRFHIFCIAVFLRRTVTTGPRLVRRCSFLTSRFSRLGAAHMSHMQVHPDPHAGSPSLKKPRHINHMHHMCHMHPNLHDPRQTPLPSRKHCLSILRCQTVSSFLYPRCSSPVPLPANRSWQAHIDIAICYT
jgi:hypothetical protein